MDIKANSVIGKPFRKNDSRDDCDTESVVSVVFSNAAVDPKVATDMEDAISLYLRRATENFDLSKNVEVRHIITQSQAKNYNVVEKLNMNC